MSTEVKYRRGTTAEHATFTGAQGEMTIDLTKNTVVVHDGVTAGGFPVMRNLTDDTTPQLGGTLDVNGNPITDATAGNDLNITTADSGSAAGDVVLTAGDGGSGFSNAGEIKLNAGDSDGGVGGAIRVTCGDAIGAGSNTGGHMYLKGGMGNQTNGGAGGQIFLIGGDAGPTGDGGSIHLTGGNGGWTSGAGGPMYIKSGAGSEGNGGNIEIAVGDASTSTSSTYNGGEVLIAANRGVGNGDGGVIKIRVGSGIGTGSHGYVEFATTHASTTSPEFRFREGATNGSNHVGLKAPDQITTSRTWTLPQDDPAEKVGKFLTTDAFGNTSFEALTEPRRNLLINGDMRFWQRDFNNVNVGGGQFLYTADRWKVFASGSSVNVTRESGYDGYYSLRMTGSSGNTGASVWQYLPALDTVALNNKTVTCSGWVYSNSATSIQINFRIPNAYDTWTTTTTIDSVSVTITPNQWNYVSASTDVVSGAAGFGIGVFVSSLGSGEYLQVDKMQLEIGDTATDFDSRPYDEELRRCQYFYEKSYGQTIDPGTVITLDSVGTISSGTPSWLPGFEFKTTKRTFPTITLYSPATGTIGSIRNIHTSSDIVTLPNYIGRNRVGLLQSSSAYAANNAYILHFTADCEL